MPEQPDEIPDDIRQMSFEEALAQLENVVRRLESGDAKLEESIDLYTQGTRLKRFCDEKLADARARIEKISIGDDGQAAGTTPLDEG